MPLAADHCQRPGQWWHFTLVTVVRRTLSVDPLIQVCGPGDQVELSARQVGNGPLRWEMADSSRLQPVDQGRKCTYTAPPQSDAQAYVLEQIKVSDAQSGKHESVWMLVRQTEPAATIRPEPGPEPDTLQLRFLIADEPREAQWRLAADSPGSITDDGLYEADPAAAQAFALVFGSFTRLGRLVEQHIVLPLPLAHFPSVLQALAQP